MVLFINCVIHAPWVEFGHASGVDSLHRLTFKLTHWLFVLMKLKLSRSGERLQDLWSSFHYMYDMSGKSIVTMYVVWWVGDFSILFSFRKYVGALYNMITIACDLMMQDCSYTSSHFINIKFLLNVQ